MHQRQLCRCSSPRSRKLYEQGDIEKDQPTIERLQRITWYALPSGDTMARLGFAQRWGAVLGGQPQFRIAVGSFRVIRQIGQGAWGGRMKPSISS